MRGETGERGGSQIVGGPYAKLKRPCYEKALCREEVRSDSGFGKITSVILMILTMTTNLNLLNAYYVSDTVPSALQGHSLDLNLGNMTSEQMFLTVRLWCLNQRHRGIGRPLKECG